MEDNLLHAMFKLEHVYFHVSPKFFVYSKLHSAHSEHRDQRMRQVVAYKRLKTMENHQPSSPRSGRARLQAENLKKILQGVTWALIDP